MGITLIECDRSSSSAAKVGMAERPGKREKQGEAKGGGTNTIHTDGKAKRLDGSVSHRC